VSRSAALPRIRGRWVAVAGIGFVNLATLTWATNAVLGRGLRDDIGPFTLASARFLIASACYVALLLRRPPAERRLGSDRRLLLGMAVCGALFPPTLYLVLRFTTAINATLINGTGPLITGLLAALLIREPMSRRQVIGAVVGLAGVVVLISGGSLDFWQELQANASNLLMLGAVAVWSLYSVLGRQVMHRRSALSTTALSTFMGLPLLLLPAAWELQALPVNLRPDLVLAILYLGLAPTVVGFLAWNAGVRHLGPSGAMVFYNTLPFYGALLAYLFLGETIGPAHLLGGALIVGGGLWAAWGRREDA